MSKTLFKKDTKVLGVFAHREDHIVCGWPIFQNGDLKRFLITCTGDKPTPFIQCCEVERIACFKRIGLPNSFSYAGSEPRPARAMRQILAVVRPAVDLINPDFIFTHNPYGEYGHYDHRSLFDLICEAFPNRKILITDIVAKSNSTPMSGVRLKAYDPIFSNYFGQVRPDQDFYRRNAVLFSNYKAWTRNAGLNLPLYPVEPAKLYIVGQGKCR